MTAHKDFFIYTEQKSKSMERFLLNVRLHRASCPPGVLEDDVVIVKNKVFRTLKQCAQWSGLSYPICRKILYEKNKTAWNGAPFAAEVTIARLTC